MTEPVTFETQQELAQIVRARRRALGMSQEEVDHEAGVPQGYTAKIEAKLTNPGAKNARSIGWDSLKLVTRAIKIRLIAVPAENMRSLASQRNLHAPSEACRKQRKIATLAERGQKGGRIRVSRSSPAQLRASARKAAQARWAKHRKEKSATKRARQAEVTA